MKVVVAQNNAIRALHKNDIRTHLLVSEVYKHVSSLVDVHSRALVSELNQKVPDLPEQVISSGKQLQLWT